MGSKESNLLSLDTKGDVLNTVSRLNIRFAEHLLEIKQRHVKMRLEEEARETQARLVEHLRKVNLFERAPTYTTLDSILFVINLRVPSVTVRNDAQH